jgi:hypothetical protein
LRIYSERGTGNTLQEDEEGRERHSGQPRPVYSDYEEHCASQLSDGKSGQFDENEQVDVTVLALKRSIETQSIPAHPALTPVSNVLIRVENNEMGIEERREAS